MRRFRDRVRAFLLSIICGLTCKVGRLVWEKRSGFQKIRIKINVSRNCIEIIAVTFIHSTSMFCLLAPIHK